MLASPVSVWKRNVAAAALVLLAALSSLAVFRAIDGGSPSSAGEIGWLPLLLAGGFLISFLSLAFMAARRGSQQKQTDRQRALLESARDELQRLRAEEQQLRSLVQSVSGDAMALLDARGRVVRWNAAAERITGHAAAELLGASIAQLYEPEQAAQGRPEADLQTASQAGHFLSEGWRLRKDGSRFWAEVALDATLGDDGKRSGFALVMRDRSRQREQQLQLQEAQDLQQTMLDGAALAIIATDAQGVVRRLNTGAERMLWYKNEELAGSAMLTRLHDPAELESRVAELSQGDPAAAVAPFEALVHKVRQGFTDERECTFVRKDGSRLQVNLTLSLQRDPQGQVQGFVAVAYDISERKRREEQTRHVGFHDPVTGLPNRALLNDRLKLAIEHAKRDNAQVGVLVLDLDHFKRVNDELGTPVGDQVLATLAQRLGASLRGSDTVGRVGGDEFLLLLPEIKDAASAERVAATLLERVAAPISIGRQELQLAASIGVSLFPEHGRDAAALVQHAETAMYHAKGAGRRCYRVFNAGMERAAAEKLVLENALRRALRQGEFALHYQPKVSLDSGEVTGLEALVRWRNPVGGLVAPARFIPAAEDNGLIVPIGEWVLRTACEAARKLQDRTGRPLQLAVNLSPRQFRQHQLVEFVARTLRETGLAPASLEIEITEGVLMAPDEEIIERLRQLRALGVSVAVDDFGTGYSSLSYITRFPIDTLKIDRSFISHVNDKESDAAVAQAIIALSHSLRTKVVAEGVETAQQLGFLRDRYRDSSQGPPYGIAPLADPFSVQGYHFCGAVPYEALAESFNELQDVCGARMRSGIH